MVLFPMPASPTTTGARVLCGVELCAVAALGASPREVGLSAGAPVASGVAVGSGALSGGVVVRAFGGLAPDVDAASLPPVPSAVSGAVGTGLGAGLGATLGSS